MVRAMGMEIMEIMEVMDTEVVTEVTVDMGLLAVTFPILATAMGRLEDTVVTWKTGTLEKEFIYLNIQFKL